MVDWRDFGRRGPVVDAEADRDVCGLVYISEAMSRETSRGAMEESLFTGEFATACAKDVLLLRATC